MSSLSANTQGLNPTTARATAIHQFSPSSEPLSTPHITLHKSSFCGGQFDIRHPFRLALNYNRRRRRKPICVLPLTEENVERVLDEVRPSLMADGGNVALHEIGGLVVVLNLQEACGSCPSSTMTLKMGIEMRLRDKILEILEIEQILDAETGVELNEENVKRDRNFYELGLRILFLRATQVKGLHKSCKQLKLAH